MAYGTVVTDRGDRPRRAEPARVVYLLAHVHQQLGARALERRRVVRVGPDDERQRAALGARGAARDERVTVTSSWFRDEILLDHTAIPNLGARGAARDGRVDEAARPAERRARRRDPPRRVGRARAAVDGRAVASEWSRTEIGFLNRQSLLTCSRRAVRPAARPRARRPGEKTEWHSVTARSREAFFVCRTSPRSIEESIEMRVCRTSPRSTDSAMSPFGSIVTTASAPAAASAGVAAARPPSSSERA